MTPTKEVDEQIEETDDFGLKSWRWERVTVADEYSNVLHKTNSPVEPEAFKTAYNEFIEEMNANILSCDEAFMKGMINSKFNVNGYNIPTHKQLFDADMEISALLLSQYKEVANMIKYVFYSEAAFGFKSGYQEYKDTIISQLDSSPKEQKRTEAAKPKQIDIPDNILNELKKHDCIENKAIRPLKWLKSKSLLAYFVEVANEKLNLKHGIKRIIEPFETLFGVTGITIAINDYKKTGTLPIGYEIIDNIFK